VVISAELVQLICTMSSRPGVTGERMNGDADTRRVIAAVPSATCSSGTTSRSNGYFAAAIGRTFFPRKTPSHSSCRRSGIFAVGYLMRPLGGAAVAYRDKSCRL